MNMLIATLPGVIGMILGSAATAQDGSEIIAKRTPASAQRFIASERPIRVSRILNGFKSEVIADVTSDDACRTTYRIILVAQRYVNPATGQLVEIPADYAWAVRQVPETSVPPYNKTINWTKVRSVTVSDKPDQYGQSWIYVAAPNMPESSIGLVYDIPEVRDRVLAAMKYLQTACDTAAETGF